MLSAFLIALREGVEASLVVGIVLVYLARTGRTHLSRYVWGGVAAAVALSLAVAIALERFNISEDGFEGLMYLVAAFFVVTMIFWMNSVAKHLEERNRGKSGEVCRARRLCSGMGHWPICFPDGAARRRGTGAGFARRGNVHGRIADVDWNGGGDRRGGGRGIVLLQGHVEGAIAPVFCGDQLDSDSGGDPVGGDRVCTN